LALGLEDRTQERLSIDNQLCLNPGFRGQFNYPPLGPFAVLASE
jgi:hypothetical protein